MNNQARRRIKALLLLFTIGFTTIAGKIAYIQIVHGESYREQSLSKRLITQKLEGRRGKIIDRNEEEIVSNRKTKNVYVSPVDYQEALSKDKEGILNLSKNSKEIAKILQIDTKDVENALKKEKSYYRLLKRDVSDEKIVQLKELNIPGIGFENATVRNYPQGSLASNVIGFTNSEGYGLEGLEALHNEILSGKEGIVIVETDRYGNKLPDKKHKYIEATEGNTLVLTLDSQIQYIVEKEIERATGEDGINPTGVHILVQDTKSGEILAMANYPTFSPTEAFKTDVENRKNGTVQFNYEPGSVFKLVTVASALDSKSISPFDTLYDPNGYITVGGHNIKNSNRKSGGYMSLSKAIGDSNNVSMVQIGQKMGKDVFYKYIEDFGFGVKTNIDVYGEEKGLLKQVEDISNLDLATNTIGQSIMVTPIQICNAVSAIANGGNLMQPYIVKEIRDEKGATIKKNESKILRQVISKETSDEMRKIMESVVSEHGGKKAFVQGYHIGGKTGTAQKVGSTGKYTSGKYVASFVGVAPMNDPKYTVMVVIDEPKGYSYYGGSTAAPIAGNIIKQIMIYNNEPIDPNQPALEEDK